MSDIKWIKINIGMYDDEKMKLIDSMPEKDTIYYVWNRLLIQAGKINDNGYIYLSEGVPYTEEMLSIIFSRTVNAIKIALITLKRYGMIQFNEKNIIKITNWEKHQNVEGMERAREQSRKRMQKYRDKKKNEAKEENNQYNLTDIEEDIIDMKEEIVTVTESDVAVTLQKKTKKENKNKNKNKKENKKIKELEGEKNIKIREDVKNEKVKAEKLGEQAIKVLSFYEKITGKVGIFSPNALLIAIDSHGENYVKMAIDKAIEVDKPNMNYVNGILRNWAKSGYPKGGIKHGKCCITDGGEFEDFKPKEARKLSEQERKAAESKLI